MWRSVIRFGLASIAWAVVATFGTAVVLGLASGFLFATQAANGSAPAVDPAVIGRVWAFAPLAGGALALFLCVAGRLPGTRLSRDN